MATTKSAYFLFTTPLTALQYHLERFWKGLKAGWLKPQDYTNADILFYTVNQLIQKAAYTNFAIVGAIEAHAKSNLDRQRGMNPPTTKGESYASPLWKPHRFCTRRKRRGIQIEFVSHD